LRLKKIILRTVAVTGGILVLAAVFAFLSPQEILCVDSGASIADVIIVLGGGHDRPARATELFKQQAAKKIIVSGFGDAETVRHELISSGIPADAVEMENKSRTTKENAELAVKLFRAEKVKSVVIVTSWYHSRRALKTFQHFAP
jgi:uncharacterized SAM-binding protein YcdF (DUF218 family)